MGNVTYSKAFLNVAKTISAEDKATGWTGAKNADGEWNQLLVYNGKDGKIHALSNKGDQVLEGVKDLEAAKASVRENISKSTSKGNELGALNFSQEAIAAMSQARDGGETGNKPAGGVGTPAAAGKGDPVAAQAKNKAFWADLLAKSPQNFIDATDKTGKPTKIFIGSDDNGKTYFAADSNLKKIPLTVTTAKDPKEIYKDNKAAIDAEVANGFGQEAVEMSGPVNQGAPAAPVAGAPDVQNPSTPTTGGNTRTAYQETSTDNPSTPGEVVAPPAAGDTLPPNQTVAPPPAATNPVSPPM